MCMPHVHVYIRVVHRGRPKVKLCADKIGGGKQRAGHLNTALGVGAQLDLALLVGQKVEALLADELVRDQPDARRRGGGGGIGGAIGGERREEFGRRTLVDDVHVVRLACAVQCGEVR